MTSPLASGRSDRAGCDSNEADSAEPTCDRCPAPMTTYDADGGYCDAHVPAQHYVLTAPGIRGTHIKDCPGCAAQVTA